MIAIDKLAARLISDEGKSLKPYWDTAEPPRLTIGIGRNLTDVGISDDECMYLFRNDMAKAQAQCEQTFDWFDSLDDVRQGVIVCMAFQMGIAGVQKFRKMILAIKVRDYTTAASEMLTSAWAVQTPNRAMRMAQIMRTGEWQ